MQPQVTLTTLKVLSCIFSCILHLKNDFPWLHRQFKENGFHCVRGSDKYWTGLWTDLTIEQMMIRSRLARDKGMNEAVRNL